MSDAPVSRGKFLKSLGSSMTGYVLGGTVGTAVQLLSGRAAPTAGKGRGTTPQPAAESSAPFVEHGPTEGNRIAFTFDDGPTPGVTERVLDELRQRHLSATFFMIGERIAASPELARRVLAEGHEIGNHSYTHPKLSTLPDPQVELELQKTQEILAKELNYHPKWFRPPYGAFRKNQAFIPYRKGLGVVLLSVDSRDWAQPGEGPITDTILSQTKAGSIVLCHDRYPQTGNCIGQILDRLLERHFNFVTLSALAGQLHPSKNAPEETVKKNNLIE